MGGILSDREVREAADALWPGETADARVELIARAAWTAIVEPSDATAGRVTQELGAVAALEAVARAPERPGAVPETVGSAGVGAAEWDAALRRWRARVTPRVVADALRGAGRASLTLVTPCDPRWPARLADLGPHAPVSLWVRGHADALVASGSAVSIVGARAATGYGEHVAAELAGGLARDGATVVSGGAYGIDGAAHRAALAEDGLTVAVMAGGADRVYPAGHAHLLQRIARTGAVISEVAPLGAPTKFRFLRRNRLIACLGAATVVVEAARRSGSLSTAGAAAELGRPLGAVPGSVLQTTSAGCHRLLREYDAVCVTSSDDVRELMRQGIDPALDVRDQAPPSPVDPTALRVRDALGRRAWLTVDEIVRRCGVSPAETMTALGLLGLEGVAEQAEGRWRLVS